MHPCLPEPRRAVKRLKQSDDTNERFIYCHLAGASLCRFGIFNLLTQLALEHAGRRDRVRKWAPHEEGYFDKLPPGFGLLVFTGFVVADAVLEVLLAVRPVETCPGAANAIYERAMADLYKQLQYRASTGLGLAKSLSQLSNGSLLGLSNLLTDVAREFAAVRVKLVTCGEFIEYVDHVNRRANGRNGLSARIGSAAMIGFACRRHWPWPRVTCRRVCKAGPY